MTRRSGLISATSMDHSLLEKWTSSLPGSRASHIQSQDTDRESPMSGISGLKRGELYLRYDQSGSCWRTYQASMFDLTMDGQHMGALHSENFPNSGMIVSGQLYQLPTQAHPISANDGGLWPTPARWQQDESLETWTERRAKVKAERNNGNGFGMPLDMAVKQWPTPTVSDTEGGIIKNVEYENGSFSRLNADGVRWGVKLKDAMASTNPEYDQKSNALNPDWVEWLMGLPKGWSSPEPLPEGAWEEWITDITSGTWWDTERDIPRVTTERTNRNKRLKALGNGIVPRCIPVFLGVVNGTGK